MREGVLAVLVLSLLCWDALGAQEPVPRGAKLRVTRCVPQCFQSVGSLLGLGEGDASVVIHFGEDEGPVEVHFDGIRSMEVSRGKERDRLVGALVGTAAVGGAGLFLLKNAGDPCTGDAGIFCGMSKGQRTTSRIAAAGVGAIIGWFAAPGRERWELITADNLDPALFSAAIATFSVGFAVRFE